MVNISWTLLIAVIVFLIMCVAVIVSRIVEERDKLKAMCKLLRSQRDEARQEICLGEATSPNWDARRIAKARGWNCFDIDKVLKGEQDE